MNDLNNKRFGHLIVLEQAPKIGNDHHLVWLCQCDCGNTIVVRGFQLTTGKKTHCGCQNSNVIDLTGKKFGRLKVIKFDGLDKNKNALWICLCDCGREIVVNGSSLRNGLTKSCGCLKLEMNAADMPDRKKKDIVEGTSLGKIRSKNNQQNNTSGHKGVSKHSQMDKWVANISFQGERIYLGLFDDLNDAIEARKKAEKIYFQPMIKKYSKPKIPG
ncbi:hypothetical protein ACIZ62_12795 [Acetobacterium carbinolicum]|uniref:hypothetical protein n=1 Tax=Acetobacterium carbinolicum TaxID=52690 RepID=UPI0039BFF09C